MPLYTLEYDINKSNGKIMSRCSKNSGLKKFKKKTVKNFPKNKKKNFKTLKLIIPGYFEKKKTLKKIKQFSSKIGKISYDKKRKFLAQKGLLKCGSKTPPKVVDALTYNVLSLKV